MLSSVYTFHLIILMMIYPNNVDSISEARKSLFKGYLCASLIIIYVSTYVNTRTGSTITAKSQYPMYLLAKEINVSTIFSSLNL